MEDDLALLTIADVKVAVPAGNGIEAGLIVLREAEEPHREMRMIVGQPEARAIHVPWSNGVPPRPSTWDLFVSTMSLLDARVDHVVITDVQEERHFFAQMVLHREGSDDPLLLTARPSDAIALALRAWGAKIYARPHVLDDAGLLPDGSHWVRARPGAEGPDAPAPLGGVIEDEELMGGWIGTGAEPSSARRGRTSSRRAAATPRPGASATPASKTTSKRTTSRKPAASKTTAAKTTAAKTTAAKKSAAVKSAASKATAAKKAAATKKSAATRTAARGAAKKSAASTRAAAKVEAVEAVNEPDGPAADSGGAL